MKRLTVCCVVLSVFSGLSTALASNESISKTLHQRCAEAVDEMYMINFPDYNLTVKHWQKERNDCVESEIRWVQASHNSSKEPLDISVKKPGTNDVQNQVEKESKVMLRQQASLPNSDKDLALSDKKRKWQEQCQSAGGSFQSGAVVACNQISIEQCDMMKPMGKWVADPQRCDFRS